MINPGSQNKQLTENSPVIKAVVFFEKYEVYFICLFVLCILPGFNVLLTSVASTIAVIYYSSAFRPLPAGMQTWENAFIVKLSGIGTAVSAIGILFGALGWPGSGAMLIGGLLTQLMCCLFTSFYIRRLTDEKMRALFNRIIYRGIFFGLVCSFFYFTPKEKLLELGFKVSKENQILEPVNAPATNQDSI
jgi:hypothetical protein